MEEQAETASEDSSPYSLTEEILRRRLNTHTYDHIGRQIYAGLLACLSSISLGTVIGWTHTATSELHYEPELTTGFEGKEVWLVSIIFLGCAWGTLITAILLKHTGPRKLMLNQGFFYILVWWLMAVESVTFRKATRFFLGWLGVSQYVAGELLLFQTTHIGLRRYIALLNSVCFVIGIMLCYVLTVLIEQIYVTIICAAIPTFHYVFIIPVPESPAYLYATSEANAAESLRWYRGRSNFYEDMDDIKRAWENSRLDSGAYYWMLNSKSVYKPLFVIVSVIFFQILSGYYIFMFYHVQVLFQEHSLFNNFLIENVIISSSLVFSKMFWGLTRRCCQLRIRPFLIFSCLGTALCLAFLVTYSLLESFQGEIFREIVESIYWSPFLVICTFFFFYDMGLHYVPKVLVIEYMPHQLFKFADTMTDFLHWFFSFFTILVFSYTEPRTPRYTSFAALCSVTFLGAVVCYCVVIEPTGKSLIQIQLAFGGNPAGRRGPLYKQRRLTV